MGLGKQWLTTLGDITWNFKELHMTFKIGKVNYHLKGITTIRIKIIAEGNMIKLIQNSPSTAYVAQVKAITTVDSA